MGKVEYSTSFINSLSGPSHHNVDVPCASINAPDAWESSDSRKNKSKSICSEKLNRIDLNPNERTKNLALKDMNLCCSTIPMRELCGTPLGNALQRLSLSSNPLREVPPELVVRLPALEVLDLSRCQLHQLPQTFHLPNLRVLKLQNNELTEFPNEVCT
jgi:Leucine-rich repeat (LRR) protein